MELSSIRRCFITYRESNANTDFPTLYSSLHFNQGTRMGCDQPYPQPLLAQRGFNPRTRMGCDLFHFAQKVVFVSFNPRTRMGCD